MAVYNSVFVWQLPLNSSPPF